MRNKLKFGDFIIIGVVLVMAGALAAALTFHSSGDKLYAEVWQNDTLIERVQLTDATDRTIKLDGKPVEIKNVREAIHLGFGMLTEDRKLQGIFPVQSLVHNASIDSMDRFLRHGRYNPDIEYEITRKYIDEVMAFAKEAAQRGCIVVLRLWNEGGFNRMNGSILDMIAECQPRPWTQRHDGWKLAENLYVESDDMFEWPDLQHDVYKEEEVFCYALRNQIGVLADGTVVPCCLDHNGDMPLGNLYDNSLNEILASPRATALYQGFTSHTAVEPLCRRCGYSAVSKRFRKQE